MGRGPANLVQPEKPPPPPRGLTPHSSLSSPKESLGEGILVLETGHKLPLTSLADLSFSVKLLLP